MECPVCLDKYDLELRRPKVLPCGHTVCSACVQSMVDRHCPVCRQAFQLNLPDNYAVMAMLAEPLESTTDETRAPLLARVQESMAVCTLEDAGEGGQRTATAAVPVDKLDVLALSLTKPHVRRTEKEEVLQRVRPAGVRTLVNVYCHEDPDWAMELLRCAKPALERLELNFPQPRHLQEVLSMRELHTLHVFSFMTPLEGPPPLVPVDQPSSLQRLVVCGSGVPLETLKSLLRQHGATLRELRLWVGTAGNEPWPECCNDLHLLVEPLTALSTLVLDRDGGMQHDPDSCEAQLSKVREKMPSGNIFCYECNSDDVPDVVWFR